MAARGESPRIAALKKPSRPLAQEAETQLLLSENIRSNYLSWYAGHPLEAQDTVGGDVSSVDPGPHGLPLDA